MTDVKDLLILLIGSSLVSNVVLSQFLGLCPFLGVSKKVKTAASMGVAVIFVITLASTVAGLIYKFILVPLGIEYLQTIKDKAIDKITISLTTDLLNDEIVMELNELLTSSPGKTQLYFLLHDSSGKKHVLLRSETKMIDVRNNLIQYIEKTDALSYKIN